MRGRERVREKGVEGSEREIARERARGSQIDSDRQMYRCSDDAVFWCYLLKKKKFENIVRIELHIILKNYNSLTSGTLFVRASLRAMSLQSQTY